MSSSSEWYLATTKPRQETRAEENLKNQGIKSYSPIIKVEKVRSGKKRLVEEPMFTGYIFINVSPEDAQWHKVRSTRGIRDWVRFSGNVAKVPQNLINQFVKSEQEFKLASATNSLKHGDAVRILSGPFEGLKGMFVAESGEQRAMILIDFLGKQSRLNVANEQIIAD
ncbi:transcription/translation regulatory transformer protein RfaH [Aliikangiella marina]|uniref:Transcription/translation regulatory transformer protein RfaH n=1 Tax=Aliikangiella marina TaxID=1712262 RepID=A0A545TIL5_9GAMM|nr:transcription/translation regulatory transformer protein RfaH [Aliikangiella marina]TQV77021.1 transcription/translation regulatory transformer protein RfaH [Aliikangiella marina]